MRGVGGTKPSVSELRRSRLDGHGACVGLGEGVRSCCGAAREWAASVWGVPWPTAAAMCRAGGPAEGDGAQRRVWDWPPIQSEPLTLGLHP